MENEDGALAPKDNEEIALIRATVAAANFGKSLHFLFKGLTSK